MVRRTIKQIEAELTEKLTIEITEKVTKEMTEEIRNKVMEELESDFQARWRMKLEELGVKMAENRDFQSAVDAKVAETMLERQEEMMDAAMLNAERKMDLAIDEAVRKKVKIMKQDIRSKMAELDDRWKLKLLGHEGYSFQLEQYVRRYY